MNIWKIASRWSNTGTKESSILDLFRKYRIVFSGREQNNINDKVNKGDLIAISDGLKIVSVAKVISTPNKITSFTIQEDDKQRFDYSDWVVGFRVEIFDLNNDEVFSIARGRTFQAMNKESKIVKELYNSKLSSNTNFEINSYTYNLFDNNPNQKSLIQENIEYIIPVYQRPYSWNETQIETLIRDIFISFWGYEKNSPSEPIFIGTMQLSNKANNRQNIIDGQQRITTLTLLLKFLVNKYPNNEILKNLDFKWLDSAVNKRQESTKLKEVLFNKNFNSELNKYAENYKLLETYFELNILSDEDEIIFNENDFIKHLLTNLYFVVIETKAGLSKTLQIFNAINTTGLDLNNTDIFKIRLYEYLSNNGDSTKVFDDIDKLYEKIDINNSNANNNIIDMNGILSIYKSFLISKYNLNMTFWKMATGTFFERLFDTLLNIKQWDGLSNIKDEKDLLKTDDINKIIDIRYEWENKYYGEKGDFDDFNTMLSLRLFWWSRYSNYWNLIFVYLLKEDKKCEQLIQELSRLYITYTLIYQKQINEIHRFTKNIFNELIQKNKNIDEIIEQIKDKYLSKKSEIEAIIKGNIFWNPKIKNILTRMSASIEEYNAKISIKNIEELVFDEKIDIEHIQSFNDENIKERENIKKEWGEVLNSIGNLMVLEYGINRSIGNKTYGEKIKFYKKSVFSIVKTFPDEFTSWELSLAQERRDKEVNKIKDFFYGDK